MERYSKKNKRRINTRCDFKLIAHNAVRFDKWVALQKSNPCFYVISGGSIDPFRERRIKKLRELY